MTDQELETEELRVMLEKKNREVASLQAELDKMRNLRFLDQAEIMNLRRMIGAYEGE